MYVRDICCGNCGNEISIEKEVDYNDVVSFYCPNCCQFRKEQIKYDKTGGDKRLKRTSFLATKNK